MNIASIASKSDIYPSFWPAEPRRNSSLSRAASALRVNSSRASPTRIVRSFSIASTPRTRLTVSSTLYFALSVSTEPLSHIVESRASTSIVAFAHSGSPRKVMRTRSRKDVSEARGSAVGSLTKGSLCPRGRTLSDSLRISLGLSPFRAITPSSRWLTPRKTRITSPSSP